MTGPVQNVRLTPMMALDGLILSCSLTLQLAAVITAITNLRHLVSPAPNARHAIHNAHCVRRRRAHAICAVTMQLYKTTVPASATQGTIWMNTDIARLYLVNVAQDSS